MATTYCINTTLVDNGSTHQSDYWPDGEGQQWPGYVTSEGQLRAELRENLSNSRLDLYVVTSTGRAKLIMDDDELKRAVDSLPDRGVLAINAVARSRGRRYRRYQDEWEVTEDRTGRWYDKEDWDDSSDDEGYQAEEIESYGVETSKDKVRAIMKRFDVSSNDPAYVPDGPLYREEEATVRSEVCYLQYFLTRLGYMQLSATRQLVGSFQSNTEKAVRSFREAYGVYGGNMDVYNRRTARMLSQVVEQYREAGHKYL